MSRLMMVAIARPSSLLRTPPPAAASVLLLRPSHPTQPQPRSALLQSFFPSPSSSSSSSAFPLFSSFARSFSAAAPTLQPTKKKLPGYILPRQKTKTAILKLMLKMKHLRSRIGKTGQRPRRPRYGHDDRVLSKMNI
ncbi:hypothetical protein DFJ73DRAFT_845227 [Zopfochytrium polystomum]|nr:hypothetical protein DFJ73DRAFT_845227 [Zopfochytrium polystomum]